MRLKMYAVAVIGTLLMSSMVSADLLSFLDDWSKAVTGDNYVFVGGDLQLDCTLDEDRLKTYTANNISFQFQYHAMGDVICVPASNVKVVSRDVARLLIQNVSMKDAGPYFCYVRNNTQCPDDSGVELVGTSDDITVDYPPHNVINFSCVVYNWDALMVCTWKHPVDYVNTSIINVTTLYISSGQSPYFYACPEQHYNRCSWSEMKFTASYNYQVYVTVKNLKTNNTTTYYSDVFPSRLVKPDPVQKLAISMLEERPDCLVLSWDHSRPTRDKVYKVKHSSKKDRVFTVLADNLTDTNYTACGYPPYTYHNFSVECYPTVSYRGFWSDPEYVYARTPMTAPSDGPRITQGSYTTTYCVKGVRNVTVMWQKVDESAQNGKIDGFFIKVGGKHVMQVPGDVYSATIANLPCYSTSELTIVAHNEGGESLKPSVLVIPSIDVSVPKMVEESFSVEIASNHSLNSSVEFLRALWEVDGETTDMNYTIFWCKGFPGQACKGEVNWGQADGTQTSYNLPIAISDAGEYIYGISVMDPVTELASGLVWTGCLFKQKQIILQQMVQKLDLSSEENAVVVRWSPIPCTYQSRVKVTNYMVKWCQSDRCNHSEEIFNYSVPAIDSMYTVSELTANVLYNFTVQPLSYGDMGGEVKPWKYAVPVSAEKTSTRLNVPVMVGVFVSIVIVLPLAAFIIWRCRKGKIKSEKLSASKLISLPNSAPKTAGSHPPLVGFSPGNGTVRLLQPPLDSNCSSSDSECDLPIISPERTTSSDLCDSHQLDGRAAPGSTFSNVNSIQSYHQFAYAPLTQSSGQSSGNLEECVVHVDSSSAESSNMQIGLTQENDINKQPSMTSLDHSTIRGTPVCDTLIDIVAVGVTSPVIQHISVVLNEAKAADATCDDLFLDSTNDSCSEPVEGNYQPRPVQEDTETSHLDETGNFSSSNGVDFPSYSQLSLFLGQQGAESDIAS